jgi:hypothetical protein
MTKWAGKNGAEGNWVNHFRVPFYKNIRITGQVPPPPPHPPPRCSLGGVDGLQILRGAAQVNPNRPSEIFPNTTMGLFAILRGLEGDESTLAATTQLGGVPLPPLKSYNVQLRLLKNTAYNSEHLEFVPLANISRWQPGSTSRAAATATSQDLNVTGGALFLATVGFRPGKGSRGLDWGGGCWWALTNKGAALEPGKAMLLGTGIEDFFNSGFAFSFFGKTFHNDLSGLTHVHGSTGHGMDNPRPDWWSAYRYFDQDPLTFSDGRFEFVWRNGESPGPGLTCRPGGRATDKGSPTVIDSYSWVYTWSAPNSDAGAQ